MERCFLKVWVCLFQRFHTSWMNVYSMALTSVSSHIIFKGGLWFIMYECTRKAALYIQVFVSSIDKQQSWYFCLRCLFSIPTLWRVWGSATVQLLGSSLTRRICTLQDIASIIIIWLTWYMWQLHIHNLINDVLIIFLSLCQSEVAVVG